MTIQSILKRSGLTTLMVAIIALTPLTADAHCDTMNGPVVLDARAALDNGDVTPVLKWVPDDDEAEVREAFRRTLDVRGTSEQVREMADMYFFETVVRIHRMSESVSYTGLKAAEAVDPAIAAADEALESGSVSELADLLTAAVRSALEERFDHAYHTKAHKDDSVEAGREFVEAYVHFTHLAEGIDAVASGAGHSEAEAAEHEATSSLEAH